MSKVLWSWGVLFLIPSIIFGMSNKSHWKNPSDAISEGLIDSPQKILEISLNIDQAKQSSFVLTSVREMQGYVSGLNKDGDFCVELTTNITGHVHRFAIKEKFYGAPKQGPEDSSLHEFKLLKQSITLSVPYVADVSGIKIIDKNGEIVAEFANPQITSFRPTDRPTFKSSKGIEILKANGKSVYLPEKKIDTYYTWFKNLFDIPNAFAAAPSMLAKLNVVFVASGYGSSSTQFQNDVVRAAFPFLNMQPYKARAESIIVHSLNPNTNLSCGSASSYYPWALTCDYGKVTQAVNSAGIPWDVIVVLMNRSEYGGGGGPISVSYNGENMPDVVVHEIQHTLIGLLDEYGFKDSNWEKTFFEEVGTTNVNCVRGGFPYQAWQGLVGKDDIGFGCVSNGFTSSNRNLMNGNGAIFLSTPALNIVSDTLDHYLPPLVDNVPPVCHLTISEGGRLKALQTDGRAFPPVSGTDNIGISKYELHWDGVYKDTVYAEASTYWGKTFNLMKLSNGLHRLEIKARDVKGNVSSCGSVNVIVEHHEDVESPIINSVFLKASSGLIGIDVLNGVTQIRVNGQDDQHVKEIKVKLAGRTFSSSTIFDDGHVANSSGGVIGYKFAGFISVDTNGLPNGDYVLQIEAIDYESKSVSKSYNVKILNDLAPPTVTITSPRNGEVVKGQMLVTCNAQDDVSIWFTVLYVDGMSVGASQDPLCNIRYNTKSLSRGNHVIQVEAVDSTNKRTMSEKVNIKK